MLEVVALTAVCELAKETPGHGGGTTRHFNFTEYALLDDGRRILLRGDRGLTLHNIDSQRLASNRGWKIMKLSIDI